MAAKYLGPDVSSLQTQTKGKLCIIMTGGWSYYCTSDTLLILNCWSQFLPLCPDKEWWEFRTLQRTFKVMCVFCAGRQKQLRLWGFSIVGAPEMDGKGGFDTPFGDPPSPLGTIPSVSHRGPLRTLGSRATPVRLNTTESLSLYMQGNYVETHTVEALLYEALSLRQIGDNDREERRERKEKSL